MRLAILTNGLFPYVIGGMQKHTFYLAKYLARLGVDVDIYDAHFPEIEGPRWDTLLTPDEQLHINRFPVERPRSPYFPSHYVLESYKTSVALLEKLHNGPAVDFVYAQGFSGWHGVNLRRRGVDGPPIGVNPHGLEMYQIPASIRARLENYMFRPITRLNVRQADIALCLGGGLSRIMHRLGVEPERIVLSPNGVGREWLADRVTPPNSPRAFVFVGRYERRKGIEELNQVLPSVMDSHEIQFHFIGPIPESLRLASPKVKYWGLIREEKKVREILRACDVLVCPSYSEGMPTVMLEAMASGLAVIGTRVGAVDAVVSEKSGWLIPPGDAQALRESLISALALPEDDLQAKKCYGRDVVEKMFVWDVVARRTIDGIENAVRRCGLNSRTTAVN